MDNLLSKPLEDAFFTNQDQILIEKLRVIRKMKETKESLSQISGIQNEQILDKLVSLNVRPETLASLCIIPLIEVAWADGGIDEKEKKAILQAAEKTGFKQGSIDFDLIRQWMTRKPTEHLLDAWVLYIKGLTEKLSQEEKNAMKTEIMNRARSIAEASGGFLGLGLGDRISKEEQAMLNKLNSAFL